MRLTLAASSASANSKTDFDAKAASEAKAICETIRESYATTRANQARAELDALNTVDEKELSDIKAWSDTMASFQIDFRQRYIKNCVTKK